jgi:hypothetical protein
MGKDRQEPALRRRGVLRLDIDGKRAVDVQDDEGEERENSTQRLIQTGVAGWSEAPSYICA